MNLGVSDDIWNVRTDAGAMVPYAADDLVDGHARTVGGGDDGEAPAGSGRRKGVFSARAIILGPPTKIIDWKSGNKSGTIVSVLACLADHPNDAENVCVNQKQFAKLEDGGMTLSVVIQQKGKDANPSGIKSDKIQTYQEERKLRRGSVFSFTVFSKKGFQASPGPNVICETGDIVIVNGITLEVKPESADKVLPGARPRMFEEYGAKEVVPFANISTLDKQQNYFLDTLLNWLPQNGTPVFMWMRINPNLDVAAELAAKEAAKAKGGMTEEQKKKEEERKKKNEEFESKKDLFHIPADDPEAEYHEAASYPVSRDMQDLGNKALLMSCQKWTWKNSDIWVPTHIVMPGLVKMLQAGRMPFSVYKSKFAGQNRPDPTHKAAWIRSYTDDEKKKIKEEKKFAESPFLQEYQPLYTVCRTALQITGYTCADPKNHPDRIEPVKQLVNMIFKLYSRGIRNYGICDPEDQIYVGPYLFAVTPSIVCNGIQGQQSAKASETPGVHGPNNFDVILNNRTIQFTSMKDKVTVKIEKPGVIADVACGVVNAGYPITNATAVAMLNALGERDDRKKSKLRQVAADMTMSKVMNIYKQGDQRNPLNNVQNPPVVNCCEHMFNAEKEGIDYDFFVVSNWGEKNLLKRPDLATHLRDLHAAGLDKAKVEFSAIYEEAAKTGNIADDRMRSLYGPSRVSNTGRNQQTGEFGISAVEPQPSVADQPFRYVIFAIRKDYLKQRGLEGYLGDMAWEEAICPAAEPQNKLDQWLQELNKRKPIVQYPQTQSSAQGSYPKAPAKPELPPQSPHEPPTVQLPPQDPPTVQLPAQDPPAPSVNKRAAEPTAPSTQPALQKPKYDKETLRARMQEASKKALEEEEEEETAMMQAVDAYDAASHAPATQGDDGLDI